MSRISKTLRTRFDKDIKLLSNMIKFFNLYHKKFHQYCFQYYNLKLGNFIFLENNIPSPNEWQSITKNAQAKLGSKWLAETYTQKAIEHKRNQTIDIPKATILVSLYRTKKYLDCFLGNLVSQTLFKEIEVIFLVVKPTPYELDLLSRFCERNSNCNLVLYQKETTIYQAWNDGLKIGRAPLITNMNVDDSRSSTSIASQIEFLNRNPDCDVVYQDFYFFREPCISFEAIKEMNIKSNLSSESRVKLAQGFNLPHHAPMWRKELHNKFGLFDANFISAGDYEFWLRVSEQGANFAKDNLIHTAYFLNSNGLSSKITSIGKKEARIVRSRHL